MFLIFLGVILTIVCIIFFFAAKDNQGGWRCWIICAVSFILAIVCLSSGFISGDWDDEPSEWSQLSDEEKDIIRDNVQWGHDIGVLD